TRAPRVAVVGRADDPARAADDSRVAKSRGPRDAHISGGDGGDVLRLHAGRVLGPDDVERRLWPVLLGHGGNLGVLVHRAAAAAQQPAGAGARCGWGGMSASFSEGRASGAAPPADAAAPAGASSPPRAEAPSGEVAGARIDGAEHATPTDGASSVRI